MPLLYVIGSGAAGIMAALRAASLGVKVVVLEKTGRIGTKILVSGGGKCNICHDGPIGQVLKAFRPEESAFLRPSVYRFPATDIVEMLTSRGLEVYTRPDGRIFPVHQTAKDVVAILEQYLFESGVEIRFGHSVQSISFQEGRVHEIVVKEVPFKEVKDDSRILYGRSAKNLLREVEREGSVDESGEGRTYTITPEAVVLSVGGSSYPNSGTTGDGYPWAKALGHSVGKIRAALSPIYLEKVPNLSGVAAMDIMLKARYKGKELIRWRGDFLITHQGISGPTALAISRAVSEASPEGPVEITVDFAPDYSFEDLQAWFVKQYDASPNRMVRTAMSELRKGDKAIALGSKAQLLMGEVSLAPPEAMILELLRLCGLEADCPFRMLDKKSRNRLIEHLKGWNLGPVRHVPLEKGEVVAGGISLEEIDPKTMQSRLVPNLFCAGEILDIAGPVGGYNLQSAFATGFVAGDSAATYLMEPK